MFLALGIFTSSLVLVMVRPRPLNEGVAASLGAFFMLVTGVVSAPQVLEALRSNANVLLFFIGLMVISTISSQAGFFQWSATRAITLARGDGRRLLLVVFGLGAAITAFFSNDATALVMTPVVFALVTRLKLNPLPYVFACAFIANTASVLLPVSNPVNLLAVDRFGITLGVYLRHLLLPALLAIAANIVLFLAIFRREIPKAFTFERTGGDGVRIDGFFKFVCAGLGLTAAGYVLASMYGLPLAAPALGGAAILLAGCLIFRRVDAPALRSGISWSILLFIFSLAVLVKGLENAGVTDAMGRWLAEAVGKGAGWGILATTAGTALGSNLINNWSMMMVSVSSLDSLGTALSPGLVYAAVLGADLGPNIAILGSLSSMLWLVLLRQRGLDIPPVQYLKLGLIVTPPLLLLSALGLYLSSLW